MTEQDAVERVAKAIYITNPRKQLLWFNEKSRTTGYLDEPRLIEWHELDDVEQEWFTNQAAAAITAYNAWLRDKHNAAMSVMSVTAAHEILNQYMDIMIGKENHDDRG